MTTHRAPSPPDRTGAPASAATTRPPPLPRLARLTHLLRRPPLPLSLLLLLPALACAAADPPPAPGATPAPSATSSGYAPVNGLRMYYEIHGSGRPLVLLHGSMVTIGLNFGGVLPALARGRRVIAIEQQGHGHTADVDRPLSFEQMADDTAALLRHIGVEQADIVGYSLGGGIALQLAVRHPGLVRKLVVAATAYHPDGYYPEVHASIAALEPEHLAGSPPHEAYLAVAPHPEQWSTLVRKAVQLEVDFTGWAPEVISSIRAPALVVLADSDVVRPEHAVQMFRLLGGGVAGDLAGLPASQLAVIPGTTHITLFERADWLLGMMAPFLDAPVPATH